MLWKESVKIPFIAFTSLLRKDLSWYVPSAIISANLFMSPLPDLWRENGFKTAVGGYFLCQCFLFLPQGATVVIEIRTKNLYKNQ